MVIPPETAHWFAIQVVPQHEHRVATLLRYKEQEEFLPISISRRQWSDRSKSIQCALFPGYVFCRTKRSAFGKVLSTPGVHRIVGFGGHPYPIPDAEIRSLQKALASGRDLCAVPHLAVGQRVEVAHGPLSGVSGIVIRFKNRDRLVISVDLIMKSVSVDLASSEVVAFQA